MRCFGQQRAFEWAGGCWPAPHIFHADDPDGRDTRRRARDWLGVCDREVGSRHDNMFFILQSSPCPLYLHGAGEARPPSRCRRRRRWPQNEINNTLGKRGSFLRIRSSPCNNVIRGERRTGPSAFMRTPAVKKQGCVGIRHLCASPVFNTILPPIS